MDATRRRTDKEMYPDWARQTHKQLKQRIQSDDEARAFVQIAVARGWDQERYRKALIVALQAEE